MNLKRTTTFACLAVALFAMWLASRRAHDARLLCAWLSGETVRDQSPTLADTCPPTKADTKYGTVVGLVHDGVRKFFGVPYAKPPVGKLRFCPPQEPASWFGSLKCQRCQPQAIQPVFPPLPGTDPHAVSLAADGQPVSSSEDCLYLDIFAPENAQNAPVFVMIHGGSWLIGNGSDLLQDGTNFAKQGIIVVCVTYRLGAWGFISHPDIAQGANLGMLDQIQALKWVQENIAAFGGNPHAVTVGGESAGAFCSSALALSPITSGLFQQIILQSGNILGPSFIHGQGGTSLQAVQARTQDIMQRAGCADVDELRRCPAEKLVKAATFDQDFIATVNNSNNIGVVGDGHVLPRNFQQALNSGKFQKVKMLAGFNRDEGTLFLHDTSLPNYQNFIHRIFEGKESEINAHFPVNFFNVRQRCSEMIKYVYFIAGTKMMADQFVKANQVVYLYHFDYLPPGDTNPFGIAHASELNYVFNNLFGLDQDLHNVRQAQRINTYWSNFIKNGDPNGEGLPRWEKYTSQGVNCLNLAEEATMRPLPNQADIDFIAERLVEP